MLARGALAGRLRLSPLLARRHGSRTVWALEGWGPASAGSCLHPCPRLASSLSVGPTPSPSPGLCSPSPFSRGAAAGSAPQTGRAGPYLLGFGDMAVKVNTLLLRPVLEAGASHQPPGTALEPPPPGKNVVCVISKVTLSLIPGVSTSCF